MKKFFVYSTMLSLTTALQAQKPMNVVLFVADDISAREFAFYNSSKWTGDRLAKTPMMDKMAEEGCFVETMWAATICKPSRITLMTGSYAHNHKLWDNRHIALSARGLYGLRKFAVDNGNYRPRIWLRDYVGFKNTYHRRRRNDEYGF